MVHRPLPPRRHPRDLRLVPRRRSSLVMITLKLMVSTGSIPGGIVNGSAIERRCSHAGVNGDEGFLMEISGPPRLPEERSLLG